MGIPQDLDQGVIQNSGNYQQNQGTLCWARFFALNMIMKCKFQMILRCLEDKKHMGTLDPL